MNQVLAQAISAAVARVGATSASLTSASRSYALYEGFVFACVVEALGRRGAQFEVHDRSDNPVTRLVFRAKRGRIYPPNVPYTFVLVRRGTREYELHTDLQVEGRSKVLHELDVTLLDRDEAIRCRQAGVSPRHGKVVLLAECKFYGRSLPLEIGREFLGLSSEFTVRVKTIVSNVRSDSVGKMIASHKGTANFDISPMDPALVEQLIGWLATELQQAFREGS